MKGYLIALSVNIPGIKVLKIYSKKVSPHQRTVSHMDKDLQIDILKYKVKVLEEKVEALTGVLELTAEALEKLTLLVTGKPNAS